MNLAPAFALVANMGVHFPETGANLNSGTCAAEHEPSQAKNCAEKSHVTSPGEQRAHISTLFASELPVENPRAYGNDKATSDTPKSSSDHESRVTIHDEHDQQVAAIRVTSGRDRNFLDAVPSSECNSTPGVETRDAGGLYPFGRFLETDCVLCLKPYSGYLPECPHCTHPQLVLE